MSVGKPSEGAFERSPRLDASALKAYAHPLRLRMIRYLNDHGAATATELAKHLDESTGQTSYHLRQLARHGLVEEDTERGTGRERWWRSRSFQVDATHLREDPGLSQAAAILLHGVVQDRAEALDRWIGQAETAPQEWIDVSLHSQSTLVLSPAELAEMNQAVGEVVDRFTAVSRARQADGRLEGTRRVRAYYDAFPLPEAE